VIIDSLLIDRDKRIKAYTQRLTNCSRSCGTLVWIQKFLLVEWYISTPKI